MSVRTWDAALGTLFAGIGLLLVVAGWRLPPGLAGVPGPGVFPIAIGAVLIALGLVLASTRTRDRATYWEREWTAPETRQVVAIVLLLIGYVALWEVVPFIWRTPALLLGIYLVVGEPWLRSLVIAAAATGVLAGVFSGLLRVRL
jgi:hypothetical protein